MIDIEKVRVTRFKQAAAWQGLGSDSDGHNLTLEDWADLAEELDELLDDLTEPFGLDDESQTVFHFP